MRIEIELADELPEARILRSMSNPVDYVRSLIHRDSILNGQPGDGVTPDYNAIFREAQHCPSVFKSRQEVDEYIEELRDEWHQSA